MILRGLLAPLALACGSVAAAPYAYITNQGSHDVSVIDLAAQKVGVFGRLVKLDAALKPGDRIEIYRGIIADPETVPRKDLADDRAGPRNLDREISASLA